MTNSLLVNTLKCFFARDLGPVRYRALLAHFGSMPVVFEQLSEAKRIGLLSENAYRDLIKPNEGLIEAVLAWQDRSSEHHLIAYGAKQYPSQLMEIPDSPMLLWLRGNPSHLNDPQLAIVGSRSMSHYGRQNAYAFGRHLASCGLTITSGLAYGVDSQAHIGALDKGVTVAVLGSGLSKIYPKSHTKLAHRVIENGALVSLWPENTAPLPGHFPARNRVISGLSVGVLVVEAALQSGSLITARLAMEQGKEVFVIPGSIHSPLSKGGHQLIQQGAQLVEDSKDILTSLKPILQSHLQAIPCEEKVVGDSLTSDPEYEQLLMVMGHEPITVDRLVELTGLDVRELSMMLLQLELRHQVVRTKLGYLQTKTGGDKSLTTLA